MNLKGTTTSRLKPKYPETTPNPHLEEEWKRNRGHKRKPERYADAPSIKRLAKTFQCMAEPTTIDVDEDVKTAKTCKSTILKRKRAGDDGTKAKSTIKKLKVEKLEKINRTVQIESVKAASNNENEVIDDEFEGSAEECAHKTASEIRKFDVLDSPEHQADTKNESPPSV